MAKLITNTHDAVEIYFESGSARIRFKEWINLKRLSEEKLEFLNEYSSDESLFRIK